MNEILQYNKELHGEYSSPYDNVIMKDSEDGEMDQFGRQFIDLCLSYKFMHFNGREIGDIQSRFYFPKHRSTWDFFLQKATRNLHTCLTAGRGGYHIYRK